MSKSVNFCLFILWFKSHLTLDLLLVGLELTLILCPSVEHQAPEKPCRQMLFITQDYHKTWSVARHGINLCDKYLVCAYRVCIGHCAKTHRLGRKEDMCLPLRGRESRDKQTLFSMSLHLSFRNWTASWHLVSTRFSRKTLWGVKSLGKGHEKSRNGWGEKQGYIGTKKLCMYYIALYLYLWSILPNRVL